MSFLSNALVNFHKTGGYSSELEDEQQQKQKQERLRIADLLAKKGTTNDNDQKQKKRPSIIRSGGDILALNAYERHKRFLSAYSSHFLQGPPPTRAKTDYDVIQENYRFLGDFDEEEDKWEKKIAKSYYDKLFKEYCVADMSRYKEGKIGMRWRTQQEVFDGKGQLLMIVVQYS